jgi:hypothetical protein
MIDRLKNWWLRWLHAEYANSLEFRIQELEAKQKAMSETVDKLAKRFILPREAMKPDEPKPLASLPWPIRREWLEKTDGGRIKREVRNG